MLKITMAFVASFLVSQSLFANNLNLLASCENIADNEIGSIVVSQLVDYPGNLLIAVGFRDGSQTELSVNIQEWRQKSFTLPSTKNSNYRLLYWEKTWVLYRDDTSHVNQKPIDCRVL